MKSKAPATSAKSKSTSKSKSKALSPRLIATLPGMSYSSHTLAFSPDGAMLASGGHGTGDRLWRTSDGKQLHALGADDHVVTRFAFSPDGRRLAVASTGNAINVWDTQRGTSVHALKLKGMPRGVAFSPDGKQFAGAVGKSILVWDAATGAEVKKLDQKGIAERVRFLADGRLLVHAGKSLFVNALTAGSGFTIDHKASIMSFDVSPDGKTILTAGGKHHARLWDAATGKPGRVFDEHDELFLYYASFSHDGKRILTGDEENNVRLWDVASGDLVAKWSGDEDGATAGSHLSPDGKLLVAQFDELHLIDLSTHAAVAKLPFVADSQCLAFSPDGSHLAAGSDAAIMLWRLR